MLTEVGLGIAALAAGASLASALAALRAAKANRESVDLAHRPFVMPSYVISSDRTTEGEDAITFNVTLHNEGGAVALDTSWATVVHRDGAKTYRRCDLASPPTAPQRAIRPAESVSSSPNLHPEDPRDRIDVLNGPRTMRGNLFEADWRIVIRYTDVAGRRWEYIEPKSSDELAPVARLVESPDW
jgi:hypothetical protein